MFGKHFYQKRQPGNWLRPLLRPELGEGELGEKRGQARRILQVAIVVFIVIVVVVFHVDHVVVLLFWIFEMEQRGSRGPFFWAFTRIIFERIVNVELFEKIHSHCSLDFECVSFCGCFVQLVALSCSLAWLLLSGDGKER